MEVIRDHLHHSDDRLPCTALNADRLTLAKRRWRGVAADGMEFGFDLERPLADGDVFYQSPSARYQLVQEPEAVLEIVWDSPEQAAKLGWNIGNLHFPIAVTSHSVLAPDDPAVRQMLDRAGVGYQPVQTVFRPLKGGHAHGNHAH